MLADWPALLRKPKAILGPYQGKAPPLSSFAPYAWRAQFDHVAIAGHFTLLPEQVPPSWGGPDQARAEVVFEFTEIRALRVDGILEPSVDDDSLHNLPVGTPGECSLVATSDPFLEIAVEGIAIPWK